MSKQINQHIFKIFYNNYKIRSQLSPKKIGAYNGYNLGKSDTLYRAFIFSGGTNFNDEQDANISAIFVTFLVSNNGTDLNSSQYPNINFISVTFFVSNKGTFFKATHL